MSTELPAELTELLDTADFEGDGRVRLRGFQHDDRGCEVELELATNVESQRWRFSFVHCLDYSLQSTSAADLALHAVPHALLWPHVDQRATLWFSGAPREPARVAEALRARHRAVTGGFSVAPSLNGAMALSTLLELGMGQVAYGPLPLLHEYAAVLHEHGVSTTLKEYPHQHWGIDLESMRALTWGNSYVAGSGFQAQRIDAAT